MADQEHRAVVGLQQFFQQFQRLDVEVVGRLVEHQHVGRQREQARQQQPVALAAGQRAHRRVGARRREQEVAQVAHHVFAAAADLDPFAARGDGVGQRRVEVQRAAHLVEVGHLQLGAAAHRARTRLQFAEDQLQQRRLAGAVGPDQADLVAAQEGGAEMADDGLLAACRREVQAHVLELGDDLAAGRAAGHLQPHAAQRLAPAGALLAQRHQPRDAADAACAPRLHALAYPHLFLRQQLVGARAGHRLGLQLAQLGGLEGGQLAGVAAQLAAVELDDAGGHVVDEGAVVRDQQHAATEVAQQAFEPGDGVQVEVVGRLVEQQHVGRGDERARQRDALFQAAGELAHRARAVQVQAVQRLVDTLLPGPAVQRLDAGLDGVEVVTLRAVRGAHLVPMRLVALAQRLDLGHAFADDVEHGGRGVELGLLRHVDHAQALLRLQQAVVELLDAGQHLQQRGLAAAVAADQRQPLAAFERQGGAVEQRDMAVGEVRVA